MGAFLRIARLLGYGSPQQIAARRTLALYEVTCSGRAEEEAEFWREREFLYLFSSLRTIFACWTRQSASSGVQTHA